MSTGKQSKLFMRKKTDSDYTSGQFVGAHISHGEAEYLRLLALQDGSSMHRQIKMMIRHWHSERYPRTRLLNDLVDNAYTEWVRLCSEGEYNRRDKKDWDNYVSKVSTILTNKKIGKPARKIILQGLEKRWKTST
jgi:hypothetical protein